MPPDDFPASPARAAEPHGLPQPQPPLAWRLPAALLGMLAGTAVQLQQPALWPAWAYAALVVAMPACSAAAWLLLRLRMWPGPARAGLTAQALAFCAGAVLCFGACGLRAGAFLSQALDPALEGRDVRVAAMVAAMPSCATRPCACGWKSNPRNWTAGPCACRRSSRWPGMRAPSSCATAGRARARSPSPSCRSPRRPSCAPASAGN